MKTQIKYLLSKKHFFLFELGFIVLVALDNNFWSHQNYQLRIYLCVVVILYIAIATRVIGLNRKNLGLTTSNWVASLRKSLVSTTVFFIALLLLKLLWPSLFALGIQYGSMNQVIYRLLAYVVISVPVQEIVFRGYIVNRLEQLSTNKIVVVLISALIFSAIHWPFRSLLLTVGSFMFGVFLAINFLKFRNLYSLMVIHGILGIVVTLFTVQLNL